MNAAISASFSSVAPTWKALPWRPPRRWMAVTTQMTARPSGSGGTPGRIALAYCPNAIAASATGAAKPTVAESQPP